LRLKGAWGIWWKRACIECQSHWRKDDGAITTASLHPQSMGLTLVSFVRVRTCQQHLSEWTQSCHVLTCPDMLAIYVVETPLKDTQMSRPRLAEDMIGHYAFEAFLSYFQCQFVFHLHL
jgi:hypothetical protein